MNDPIQIIFSKYAMHFIKYKNYLYIHIQIYIYLYTYICKCENKLRKYHHILFLSYILIIILQSFFINYMLLESIVPLWYESVRKEVGVKTALFKTLVVRMEPHTCYTKKWFTTSNGNKDWVSLFVKRISTYIIKYTPIIGWKMCKQKIMLSLSIIFTKHRAFNIIGRRQIRKKLDC